MAMVESTTSNILGAHAKDIEYNCLMCCAVKPFLLGDPPVSVLSDSIMLFVYPCAKLGSGVCIIVSINTIYCEYGAC